MAVPPCLRRGAGIALVALGAACSESPRSTAAAFQRLDLRPVPRGAAVPAASDEGGGRAGNGPAEAGRIVRRVVPPASEEGEPGGGEPEGWRVTAREHSFRAGGLELVGFRKQEVVVPGPFDPASFGQIAVRLETPAALTLRLQLRRGGEVVLSAPSDLFVPGGGGPRAVLFDLPRARLQKEPAEDLVLSASEVEAPWRLIGVDLVEKPLEAFLPRGREALIETGGEAHRGLGLSSAAPLSARALVPPHGRLSYAFAWPPAVRDPARAAELRVTVAAREGGRDPAPIQARHALGELPWDGPVWRDAVLELGALAGREVEVTFELVPEGPAPAVCALAEAAVLAPEAEPPTVLLVTSDTHRADHVEGAPRAVTIRTPALLALAERGVAFDDAFSATNVTVPSHVALMTATPVRDTGVWTNRAHLSADAPTLAEAFRAAGYRTFAVVSNRYLGRPDTGLGQGFDRVAWPRQKTWVARQTVDRLSEWLPRAQGQPLFVWLHVFDAHFPYTPPADLERAYYPADRDPFAAELPEPDFPVPPAFAGLRDADYLRALYSSEITSLDRELARVLERPRFREGIVAVTADHGESLGHQGVFWDHTGVFPDTLHVPLILSWPGGPRGLRVATPVRMIDLGRTLLDLAGLDAAPFPGTDLTLALEAQGPAAPRFALSDHGRMAAVEDGGWLCVLVLEEHPRSRYVPEKTFRRHALFLFDLARDPDCQHDLTEAEPERARALRAELIDWLDAPEETGWGSEGVADESVLAEIAELGYTLDASPDAGAPLFDRDCRCDLCRRWEDAR